MTSRARWGGTAAALWAAFQVSACDAPTAPEVTPPSPDVPEVVDTAMVIDSVRDLVPGKQSALKGRNLNRLTALELDGIPVDFTATDSLVSFTVPAGPECDVDGREVSIRANGKEEGAGVVRVDDALELRVGESQILDAESLRCLQMGRGSERYVMSAGSFARKPQTGSQFTFRALGTTGDEGTSVAQTMARAGGLHGFHGHDHAHDPVEAIAPSSDDFEYEPFDDYAHASVGDTLQFVDWGQPGIEGASAREDVPSYEGVVLALVGNQMVVVDQTIDDPGRFEDPEVIERLTKAAELAEELSEPALKAVFGPDVRFAPGAGGRAIHIIRTLSSGAAGLYHPLDVMPVRWSSNIYVTALSERVVDRQSPGSTASTMIHELAHAVDREPRARGVGQTSAGWYAEAVAVATQDAAARIQRGGLYEAPPESGEGLLPSRLLDTKYTARMHSPWGAESREGGPRGPGSYSRGGDIVRFVQEQFDEHELWRVHQGLRANHEAERSITDHPAPTFWGIDALANLIGMAPEDVLEKSMLQELTYGFLDPDVARAEGTPVTRSWAPSDTPRDRLVTMDPRWVLTRGESAAHSIDIPPGGYGFWYVFGDEKRGLSLTSDQLPSDEAHRIRLTRLR